MGESHIIHYCLHYLEATRLRLLDQLDWPFAHMVGYSFGGTTAVGYVASRPSRVQSFVLVAPAGLLRFSHFTAEHFCGDDEAVAR